MQDQRLGEAADWAAAMLGRAETAPRPVSGDASFRRYFRVDAGERTLILMDAPPDRENSRPFLDIAARLRAAGLRAPAVIAFDLDRGFGLLEDFGDTLYREIFDEGSADALMPALFDVLEGMATRVDSAGLPDYDHGTLQAEMDLFTDWYLERHRGRPLTAAERRLWTQACAALSRAARAQPQVFVHKDFHSCNLLHTPEGPGLIDFQDGLRGPLAYDLVSLLWDRYIAWPRERLEAWMEEARHRLAPAQAPAAWRRQCDWMGLQRNLKIVGIFARLRHRDGKQGYVEMIPRFYGYLLDVLPRYPEFAAFTRLLERPECAP